MTIEEFIAGNITGIILIISNLVLVIGSYYRIKFKLDQTVDTIKSTEKTAKSDIALIEEKRAVNVSYLREIYDKKIEDAGKEADSKIIALQSEMQKEIIEMKSNQESIKQSIITQNEQILNLIDRLEKNYDSFTKAQNNINDKLTISIDAIKESLITSTANHSSCIFYKKGVKEVKDLIGIRKF